MTTPDRDAADALKAEIRHLNEEWDRIDKHGADSVTQNRISHRLKRLYEEYKDLTGKEYSSSDDA